MSKFRIIYNMYVSCMHQAHYLMTHHGVHCCSRDEHEERNDPLHSGGSSNVTVSNCGQSCSGPIDGVHVLNIDSRQADVLWRKYYSAASLQNNNSLERASVGGVWGRGSCFLHEPHRMNTI